MTDLSPEARRLISCARHGDNPTEEDEHRIDRSLAKRVAVGAAALALSTGAAKSAAGAAVGLGSAAMGWGKTVLWVALGLGAAAGAHQAYRAASLPQPAFQNRGATRRAAAPSERETLRAAVPAETAPAPVRDMEGVTPRAESGSPVLLAIPPAARGAPTSASLDEMGDARNAYVVGAQRPPVASFETTSQPPAVQGSDNRLRTETAALREAHGALRSGDAAWALRLIEKQNDDYRDGTLVQERAAARVFALCELGREAEARTAARDFELSWPSAPMLRRVQAACSAR